jgi:hypothetical protein
MADFGLSNLLFQTCIHCLQDGIVDLSTGLSWIPPFRFAMDPSFKPLRFWVVMTQPLLKSRQIGHQQSKRGNNSGWQGRIGNAISAGAPIVRSRRWICVRDEPFQLASFWSSARRSDQPKASMA